MANTQNATEQHYCPRCDEITAWVWNADELECAHTRKLEAYGYRWFERTNGNTYHTVILFENGTEIYRSEHMAYGYDSHWEQTALAAYLEHTGDRYQGALWRYAEERGIELHRSVTDVRRKRDLFTFAPFGDRY